MGERLFGGFSIVVALAYIASATQLQSSFLADPVGPKAFPVLVGSLAVLASLLMVIRPTTRDSDWPDLRTFAKLLIALVVLVLYTFALTPFGFILPTALASGLLSYQIAPRWKQACLSGVGLSLGLFILFRYVLGLSLYPIPRTWLGS